VTDAVETPFPIADSSASTLAVDVISDVVCPWCYIGKRKLEMALAELTQREPELDIRVRWHPFQLNPDIPETGIPRTRYLEDKFGGRARAADIYARVRAVGATVGIGFDFERIAQQPNTLDAHRLIAWAQDQGDQRAADVLVERMFHAYCVDGLFLGDHAELARIAARAGFEAAAAAAWLQSDGGRTDVAAEDREARAVGVQGVPFFIFNSRTAVSGAHDPPALLEAIAAAR
jgi:predicted DsbA family dithiol-disulfide isomerase